MMDWEVMITNRFIQKLSDYVWSGICGLPDRKRIWWWKYRQIKCWFRRIVLLTLLKIKPALVKLHILETNNDFHLVVVWRFSYIHDNDHICNSLRINCVWLLFMLSHVVYFLMSFPIQVFIYFLISENYDHV